jgi:hypothetical protein
MNMRKLFFVPAFLSVSFAMVACTSGPSDEQVIHEARTWVQWALDGNLARKAHFWDTSDMPFDCAGTDQLITDFKVEGKSVSGKEAHVRWSMKWDCGTFGQDTSYQEFFYRKYDEEGWLLEQWVNFEEGL